MPDQWLRIPALVNLLTIRWADAQYGKGEYDAAMALYSETIGHLEPSYVIRCVIVYVWAIHVCVGQGRVQSVSGWGVADFVHSFVRPCR